MSHKVIEDGIYCSIFNLANTSRFEREQMASELDTSIDLLRELIKDNNINTRACVAANLRIDKEILDKALSDPNMNVRLEALRNPTYFKYYSVKAHKELVDRWGLCSHKDTYNRWIQDHIKQISKVGKELFK